MLKMPIGFPQFNFNSDFKISYFLITFFFLQQPKATPAPATVPFEIDRWGMKNKEGPHLNRQGESLSVAQGM